MKPKVLTTAWTNSARCWLERTKVNKSQRLNTVIDLATDKQHQQAERFANSQQYCQAQRQKLEELQQYYREYAASGVSSPSLLDLQRLQEQRLFIAKLAKAIELQKQNLLRAEQAVTAERQQWLRARQHHLSLEKLQQRYVGEEQRAEQSREQRQADELSAQRFVWSSRGSHSLA